MFSPNTRLTLIFFAFAFALMLVYLGRQVAKNGNNRYLRECGNLVWSLALIQVCIIVAQAGSFFRIWPVSAP